MKNFGKMFEKIKQNKKLQIGFVILLCVALFLIFGSALIPKSSKGSSSSTNTSTGSSTNQFDYAKSLEDKLVNVLSSIKDAGKVNVMITLEGGIEIEIAYTIEERVNNSTGSSNSQESSTIVKTPILITQNGVTKPVILSEKNPAIQGVVIVASGAGNTRVKLDILRATVAVLSVEPARIEIFAGQ